MGLQGGEGAVHPIQINIKNYVSRCDIIQTNARTNSVAEPCFYSQEEMYRVI